MASQPNTGTNFVTGEVRLSFVHLVQPYAYQPGAPEKYSVTCLLPKTDTVTKQNIDRAIEEAKRVGAQNKWNGVIPPIVPTPVWDGDGVKSDGTAFGEECRGMWVFTASANADRKPSVVDTGLQEIIDASQLYSGMYGRVSVNVFAYANTGKRGLGFGLENVQKTRDGEVLGGGRMSAATAFGAPANNGFQQAKIDPFTGQPLPIN